MNRFPYLKYANTNCESTQKNGLNLQKFKGTWYNRDQASCIHAEALAPTEPCYLIQIFKLQVAKKPFPTSQEEALRIVMLGTSVTFSDKVLKEPQACCSSLTEWQQKTSVNERLRSCQKLPWKQSLPFH